MLKLADTPSPPYYAVIFTSLGTPKDQGYAAMTVEASPGGSMKILPLFLLFVILVSLLGGCARFRKENPLNVKCPSCGYIWELTPAEPQ